MSATSASPASAIAPWIARQTALLLAQRGHAWLLQGPSGLGQFDLAWALARAWLCDAPSSAGACGVCSSCHAIAVHTHADLCVLMPEALMLELGLPLDDKTQKELDDKKRKPSKEIRVEAMRDAVQFSQRTSARAQGKVVLVYPAERMNTVTANALLKTLEEPPGKVRFVLATQAAHQLLPTIRSRCQSHTLHWPATHEALDWLHAQGLPPAEAERLLRSAGGRPDNAQFYARNGMAAQVWQGLPKAMWQGNTAWVQDWSPADLLDALHKLCHDLMAVSQGAEPRFYEPADLSTRLPGLAGLSDWARALSQAAQTITHPYNPGLLQEALVSQAQQVLRG